MPQPKRFTDEELRARKNERARERYRVDINASREKSRERTKRAYERNPEVYRQRRREQYLNNPDAERQNNAKRRAADPEKHRRESREWFANNKPKRAAYEAKRRAIRRNAPIGSVSPDISDQLQEKQRDRCACCRASLRGVFHLDHIQPLSKGGAHADDNLQLLCPPCNQAKHAKDPIDFMRQRGYLL
jgi:5-methylcytosine-specific restriction endonuclease McrA